MLITLVRSLTLAAHLGAPAGAALDPLEDALKAKSWIQVETLARRQLEHDRHDRAAVKLEVLTALGVSLNEQGRFGDAEDAYRRAVAAARAIRPRNALAVLDAEENVAVELSNQGRFAEAEQSLRTIMKARRDAPSSAALLATTLNRLAAAIGAQGRYTEADPLLREALAVRLRVLGESDPLVAQSYNSLANNLDNESKLPEAEPLYRRALAIRRKLFGDADASVATTLSNLALNLQRQGGADRMTEAGVDYVEALQVSRKVWGDRSPFTATTFNNVANYVEQYGEYAEAEKLYRMALDIRVAALGKDHPDTLTLRNNLAANADRQGRTAEAVALYRAVLKARLDQLGRAHPDLVVSYNNLAALLARNPATRGEALTLAGDAVASARALTARDRSGFGAGKDAAARALMRAAAADATGANPRRYAFELLLNVAWLRARDVPGEDRRLAAEAFITAQDLDESAAGRAMALTAARVAAGTGPLAALVQRQQSLSRQAAALDVGIVRKLATVSAAEIAALREQADDLGRQLSDVDATLQRDFPRYQVMVSPSAIADEEVRSRLQPDEGLLLVIPSGDDMFSFAVSDKGLAWNRWDGGGPRTTLLVDRLRCEADPQTCASKDREPAEAGKALPYDRAAAHELYRSLVQPVEAMLLGKPRLFVTTSGALADLPLQMLLTAATAPDGDLAAAPWLGDRYAIVTLPSVAALRAPKDRRRSSGTTPFLGFGAPDLASTAASMSAFFSTTRDAAAGDAAARLVMLHRLSPLPGTKTELSAMARVLGATDGAVRTGDRATEAALHADPTTTNARVLAFATHGLLPRDIDGLAEPGLVLTPPAVPTAADDGVLTASEASLLHLRADWVILSACNTASSQGGGGDSLSGLARGFLYAGAGALLASHWRVSDEVTAVLTVETLKQMQGDPSATPAIALARAERAIRTGRRRDGSRIAGWSADWAHPLAWAPFSLISQSDGTAQDANAP